MDTTSRSERMFRVGRWRLPLWATVFAAAAVLFMLGLSLWQVQRLAWKDALIAERAARMAMPPVELPVAIADPDAWSFRHVRLTGTFDLERETYLGARSLNGNLGYHVIAPLIRVAGSPVLIDRGWVPLDLKDPAARPGSRPAATITVEGIARVSQRGGWMTPDNEPDEDFWFTVDIPAIAAHLRLDAVAPVYVESGPTPSGTWPIGGQTRSEVRNDHLQYAITWFLLALALVVIYGLYVRQRQ